MSDLQPDPATLVQRLLQWYHKSRRSLPWREDPRPYYVLLSELMLQQTQVDTVLPYFERFIARWPTLYDLGKAEEQDVLLMWSGLGYYSRARHLHRSAQIASSTGGLPQDVKRLQALPGIGPYTAGAIASIAFGLPVPVVDGNVERVLTRLDAYGEFPKSGAGRKHIWKRAEELVSALDEKDHPGDLNQALMELGALVCRPVKTHCEVCPWVGVCMAHKEDRIKEYPKKKVPTPPRHMARIYGIISGPDGLLMGRRKKDGLLGGLWEPLSVSWDGREDPMIVAVGGVQTELNFEVCPSDYLGDFQHVFSHIRLQGAVIKCARKKGALPNRAGDYDKIGYIGEVASVPLSTLAKKVLKIAGISLS